MREQLLPAKYREEERGSQQTRLLLLLHQQQLGGATASTWRAVVNKTTSRIFSLFLSSSLEVFDDLLLHTKSPLLFLYYTSKKECVDV